MRTIIIALCLAPAAALAPAGRPVRVQKDGVARRALLGAAAGTVFAMAAPALAVMVSFELPDLPSLSFPSVSAPSISMPSLSMPSMPSGDGQAQAQGDEEKIAAEATKAADQAARQAEFKRVRAQRMAAEARAQSEEYAKVMAGVGTQSFGSTTTVR